MESSVIIPITFWNNSKPTFRVSSIRVTPNGKKLVTSSLDGELSIWDLDVNKSELIPRNLLIGHTDPVTCLECTDDYAISASEGGEICRWNLSDGYCSKSIKSVFVHRKIQLFKCSKLDDDVLFTCGDYHEIFVIHSVVLQTILVLHSKTESDWISCFHVMSSLEIGHDVVSGVNKSGFIKLWVIEELSDDILYETQSSLLPVKNVTHIKCSLTQTQILTVSDKSWTIFDAKYLKKICSADRICNEKFLGGDFCDSYILIWTNESRFYLFKLGVFGAKLKKVFSNTLELPNLFEPAMWFHNSNKCKYLVQCDISGKITFWELIGKKFKDEPCFTSDLSTKFSVQSRIFKKFMREVTCCVVILGLDLFVVGCSDGTIIVVPALATLLSCYSTSKVEEPDYRMLLCHKGRINCLLYPHERYSYHNKSYLLSGGSDFSVCLWDIFSYKLIYRFCVQSGEIIKLLVPPEECRNRVRNSICSVANDHSVAILNLKELKCIVLASRQLFPVVTINWRPLDDFIIIECFDGTVYIWEMETGHLDRVLHGVTAQEVIYACKESNHEDVSNFYLREDSLVGKDHFRRGLYQIEKDLHGKAAPPITVRGFLDSFHSEDQIVVFNVDQIIAGLGGDEEPKRIDAEVHQRAQMLTQGTPTTTAKPRVQSDRQGKEEAKAKSTRELAEFLLSTLRSRGDDASRPQFGVLSESQNVSVFLTNEPPRTARLTTFRAVAAIALSTALGSRDQATDCRRGEFDLETLARLWQNRCLTIRRIARKLLASRLRTQSPQERLNLLQRWFKFLPHFASVDGAPVHKPDAEILEMQLVALVLFGVTGAEFRFKLENPQLEERYNRETCHAIAHLVEKAHAGEMRVVATNLLGRGYVVWEPNLKFERLFRHLFEMTHDYEELSLGRFTPELDRCLNAHEALVSIAIARTETFAAWLTREIAQARASQSSPKAEAAFLEKSKPEMILIVTELLERTPYIMLQYLNEMVVVLTYCVSPVHLKQEPIGRLLPILERFKQVHHCLATQRVAVGLHDGGVVIHELKTFRTHRIAAHGDTVSAVMFSPDGKLLATYSYFENRISFWHVFASIFGLGHVHSKCIKSQETSRISEESVRNHFEVADLTWLDNKSVLLHLCDDTQTVFHV